jgi:tetratricopeptide (TPR) repeat protein
MRSYFPFTSLLLFTLPVAAGAQAHAKTGAPVGSSSAEHAVTLAETGHCPEALPVLTRTASHITDKELQKRAALDGVRCASLLKQQESLLDLLRVLNQHFPHDPEVLYLTVHAYSDLSSNAAQELSQTAPTSIPGLEMDAEANEVQGKWDQAEKDYRKILEENSRYPGVHFRLARLLLSKPNPGPDFQDQAKKELQQELEIDPADAGTDMCWANLRDRVRIWPRPSGILPRRPS